MAESSTNSHKKSFLSFLDGPRKFYKDSLLFLHRCTKPDRREYMKILQAVSIGFALMGFIGYFVKLVHIPINNIIVGGAA